MGSDASIIFLPRINEPFCSDATKEGCQMTLYFMAGLCRCIVDTALVEKECVCVLDLVFIQVKS